MSEFLDLLLRMMEASFSLMEPPKAYGVFHLTFGGVGLTLAALLAWRLRNIGPKRVRIVLFCVGAFLLLAEIYKQVLHLLFFTEPGTYTWWIFPFQLCSVPMYLLLIAPVIRQGKIAKAMYSFMMLYNLLGGFMAFIEPSNINNDRWYLTFHSYAWHILLVFVGLLLITTGFGGRKMKDYWASTFTFLILCGIALGFNLIFHEASNGDLNNFFLGPTPNPLVVFKDIAASCGWYVASVVYVLVICLGAFVIFLPIHLWDRRKPRLAAAAGNAHAAL